MKKLFSVIVIIILFSSCEEDVKFNNPGFQAYKDNVLFRGIDVRATASTSGAMVINALAQDEQLVLKIANGAVGTYFLGTTNANTIATYSSNFNNTNLVYATEPIEGPVAKIATPLVAAGSGYTSGTGIATTGGSGTGLTVKTTVNTNGQVTAVQVSSPGNDYFSGDIITITGGANNAKFRVLNVEGSNGEITITENTGTTVSGKFKFNAVNTNDNPLGGSTANFQFGEFYKVPIVP